MLDAQNNRLNEFAGLLAHDLRNPLTSARGYTELVSESVDEPEASYLETALDGLDRMETLISETLALAREGFDVGEREPVELGAVARRAWEIVAPADATLTVAADRTLLADESRLHQLFENLFRNVDEHCEVPRRQAPRLHRLGSAPHPQANLIPPDLPREESAGINTRTLDVSVGVGPSTKAR